MKLRFIVAGLLALTSSVSVCASQIDFLGDSYKSQIVSRAMAYAKRLDQESPIAPLRRMNRSVLDLIDTAKSVSSSRPGDNQEFVVAKGNAPLTFEAMINEPHWTVHGQTSEPYWVAQKQGGSDAGIYLLAINPIARGFSTEAENIFNAAHILAALWSVETNSDPFRFGAKECQGVSRPFLCSPVAGYHHLAGDLIISMSNRCVTCDSEELARLSFLSLEYLSMVRNKDVAFTIRRVMDDPDFEYSDYGLDLSSPRNRNREVILQP